MRQDSKGACPLSNYDERVTGLQSTVASRGITRAALSARGAQKQIPVSFVGWWIDHIPLLESKRLIGAVPVLRSIRPR